MRILLWMATLTKGKGGSERVAAELANEMVTRGHDVMIYSIAGPDEDSMYYLDRRVVHLRREFHGGENLEQTRRDILNWKPDIGFVFYFNARLLWHWSFLKGLGIPIGVQECTNPTRAVMNFARTLKGESINTAFSLRDALLLEVQAIRLTMDSYAGSVPPDSRANTFSFRNAVPPARLSLQERQMGEQRVILNLGGFKAPNKNGMALVKAFMELEVDFPEWSVVFLGKLPPEEVQRMVSRKGLSERVIFRGVTDDVAAEFESAAIHVICSFEEGCPNAVCEAMTAGVPSIGFLDCAGTNELIKPGENGLLVERSGGPRELAGALAALMGDPEERYRLGCLAYEQAKEMFAPDAIYDRWETLFRHLSRQVAATDQRMPHHRLLERLLGDVAPSIWWRSDEDLAPVLPATAMPTLTVVVPLYNKEPYIEETLRSIAGLEFDNYEVLVVDDASSDSSSEIAQRFAEANPRFRLILRERNGGLSAARNTGLAEAKGEYVLFWDADDILDGAGPPAIVGLMDEDHADIGTGVAVRDGEILEWYLPSARYVRSTTFELTPESFSTSSTCFKVYRRSFLERHSLTFVEGLYMQDTEFNMRAFPLAERITMTPITIGEYVRVANSWGKLVSLPRIESCFEIERLTASFYAKIDLKKFESFRQAKVLTFVYQNFVRKALACLLEGRNVQDTEVFNQTLEVFRSSVQKLGEGIDWLSRHQPRVALAFLLFANRRDREALSVFRGRAPCVGFEGMVEDCHFGHDLDRIRWLSKVALGDAVTEERQRSAA